MLTTLTMSLRFAACSLLLTLLSCVELGEQPVSKNETARPDSDISARIKTTHGDIVIRFYKKHAPMTVNRFITLAQDGFYNGLQFHRAIPGFLIQTGDPSGSGSGGSGKTIKSEIGDLKHTKGSVGLAHPGDPNRGDSQFYITLKQQPELDGKYTIFAQVTEGFAVLNKIRKGDKVLLIQLE